MKIRVAREIDLLFEAIRLLTFVAQSRDFKQLQKRIEEEKLPGILWKKGIQVVEQMVKQAEKEFRQEKEMIIEYFYPMTLRDDKEITLAEVCMLYDNAKYSCTLKQVEDMLLQISDRQICKRMHQILGIYMLDQNEKEDMMFSSVITELEETDLKQEQKWNIIHSISDLLGRFGKIRPLLEQAQKLILSNQEKWQPIMDEMADTWEQYLKEKGILDILKEYLNVQLDENPKGAVLVPGILTYNWMQYGRAVADEEGNRLPDVCYMGFLFSTIENFKILTSPEKKDTLSREYCMKVLKALSEKSKLEILVMLKEKRMYGSKLAEALGLTTATISHHMNTLIVLKLVRMEKEENKVYYQINKDGIEEVFRELEQLLL